MDAAERSPCGGVEKGTVFITLNGGVGDLGGVGDVSGGVERAFSRQGRSFNLHGQNLGRRCFARLHRQ